MNLLQPWMLIALPLVLLPILIHLLNRRRFATRPWAAMMFLIEANQSARGHARLRRWLVLALRTAVVGALLFAATRPVATSVFGFQLSGTADTTILLVDRSPSMQQSVSPELTKLESVQIQMHDTFARSHSGKWVWIDCATPNAETFSGFDELLRAMPQGPLDASSNFPAMLKATSDYLHDNPSGSADVWLWSDLRESDWSSNEAEWSAVRESLKRIPRSVRFRLVSLLDKGALNEAVRVSDVRQERTNEGNFLVMTIHVSVNHSVESVKTLPLEIELSGNRFKSEVSLNRNEATLMNHRIPLASEVRGGWGRVSILADTNRADNEYFFVFKEPRPSKIMIVGNRNEVTEPLAIGCEISPDGMTKNEVQWVSSTDVRNISFGQLSLLIWTTELPDDEARKTLRQFLAQGGQVLFFPPDSLNAAESLQGTESFLGAKWNGWVSNDRRVMIEHWRGDQDLLAATSSGVGLPLEEIQVQGYAQLSGEVIPLATLSGGAPCLARLATDAGGVYFCTLSLSKEHSNLAENGVILYAILQRAIQQGREANRDVEYWTAGQSSLVQSLPWEKIAGRDNLLSNQFPFQSGVYREKNGTDFESEEATSGRLIAVNRPITEDQTEVVSNERIRELFDGLSFTQIDATETQASDLMQELWRILLIAMIIAMLLEAILSLPKTIVRQGEL